MTAHATNTRRDVATLIARLVLGSALLIAGLIKVTNLDANVLTVRAYQIVPYEIAKMIGYGLPVFEIIIGTLIIIGLFTRTVTAIGTATMVMFIAAIISVWARGLSIDCGCFGGGGQTDKHHLRGVRCLRPSATQEPVQHRPQVPEHPRGDTPWRRLILSASTSGFHLRTARTWWRPNCRMTTTTRTASMHLPRSSNPEEPHLPSEELTKKVVHGRMTMLPL